MTTRTVTTSAEAVFLHEVNEEIFTLGSFLFHFRPLCYGNRAEKGGVEHMANIITASMLYFPYVIVGLGQAIIVGAHSAGRTVPATVETPVRKVPLATFEKGAQTSRTDDKRCKVCFIPGCAVFAPR